MRRLATAILALVLLTGCGRAIDRPLRGAAPGTESPPTAGLPPTLQPSDALKFRPLPSPSPGIIGSPSPSASQTALAPIVRTITPQAQGHVPAKAPITISAVLVGRSADLKEASLTIDNADAGAQTDKRSARDWTIRATKQLPPGNHTAKVQVRDAQGTAGGFTWQFTVDEAEPPQ